MLHTSRSKPRDLPSKEYYSTIIVQSKPNIEPYSVNSIDLSKIGNKGNFTGKLFKSQKSFDNQAILNQQKERFNSSAPVRNYGDKSQRNDKKFFSKKFPVSASNHYSANLNFVPTKNAHKRPNHPYLRSAIDFILDKSPGENQNRTKATVKRTKNGNIFLPKLPGGAAKQPRFEGSKRDNFRFNKDSRSKSSNVSEEDNLLLRLGHIRPPGKAFSTTGITNGSKTSTFGAKTFSRLASVGQAKASSSQWHCGTFKRVSIFEKKTAEVKRFSTSRVFGKQGTYFETPSK